MRKFEKRKEERGELCPEWQDKKSSTKVYHVILRGNSKQDIFWGKQDYKKFIKEIYNTKEKYHWSCYQEYIAGSKLINEKKILKLFGDCKQEAIKSFVEFHKLSQRDKKQELKEYEMIDKLNDEQARQYIIEN